MNEWNKLSAYYVQEQNRQVSLKNVLHLEHVDSW